MGEEIWLRKNYCKNFFICPGNFETKNTFLYANFSIPKLCTTLECKT